MAGEFGIPYRTPCGGWPGTQSWFFEGSFQNTLTSEQGLDRWVNITVVADWHKPPASGILPYTRISFGTDWPADVSGACDLAPDPSRVNCIDGSRRYGWTNPCPGTSAQGPLWGPWTNAEFPTCAVDATHSTHDLNCYQKVGTYDASACMKIGFKNVQSMKQWYGRYDYTSHDPGGRASRKRNTISGGTCPNNTEDEQASHDGTKYLTETITAIYNDGTAQTSTATSSIDRTSGVVTGSGYEEYNASGISQSYTLLGEFIGFNASVGISTYELAVESTFTDNTVTETSSDGIGWTYDAVDMDGNNVCHATLDVSTGECHLVFSGTLPDGSFGVTSTVDLTVSATKFDHETWSPPPSPTFPPTTTSVIGSLSNLYTESNLWDDCIALSNEWDMTDDVVYPWRRDTLLTVAPLVSHNEAQGIDSDAALIWIYTVYDYDTNTTSSAPFVDPNGAIFDGTVQGAPLPAGFGPHFDRTHQTWRCCVDLDGNEVPYAFSFGAWSGGRDPNGADGGSGDASDQVVPITATRWTDNRAACFITPGPFWQFVTTPVGTIAGNCLFLQKWAEARIPSRSQDFARPWGKDRITMDETVTRCGELTGGTDLAPVITMASDSAVAVNDLVIAWGIPDVTTGIWKVTGKAGVVVTLGWSAAVIGATNASPIVITVGSGFCPVGGDTVTIASVTGNTAANGTWDILPLTATTFQLVGSTGNASYAGGGTAAKSGIALDGSIMDSWRNVGGGLVGKLRWPAAFPLAGRAQVLTASNSMPIAVTVNAPYLRTGDQIVISGATGNTGVNGTYTVTQLGASSFLLDGSVGNGDYTGNGWALSGGVDHYEFSDDQWKGDYLFFSWQQNMRDYQERERFIAQWAAYPGCHWGQPSPGPDIRVNQVLHGMPQQVSGQTITADCAAWNVRYPQVIACSPNGESWAGGHTYAMGGFAADGRYGSMWQGWVVQHVPDPLWQSPTSPCPAPDAGWNEDSGNCAADSGYPQRPWVEARQTVPVINGNTPTLPSGIYVGFLSLSDLDTSGAVSGNVLPPPGSVGGGCDTSCQPNGTAMPWSRWLAEVICVLAPDKWSAAYDAQGIAP